MSSVKAMISALAQHEWLPLELCSVLNNIYGDLLESVNDRRQDEFVFACA